MPRLIIGHVGEREARIWARGTAKTPFAFLTWRAVEGGAAKSQSIALEARHHYTGVFAVEGLEPATRYTCSVSFGKTSTTPVAKRETPRNSSGGFTTAPPAGSPADFSFLMVSCNLHSLDPVSPPDDAFRRVSLLARQKAASFLLHLGDQIYYDVPVLGKLPSLSEYRNKYHDAWGQSDPTSMVLTQLAHYMILDDHEIKDNFHNDMPVGVGSPADWKEPALAAYWEFQHIHNPMPFGTGPLYYTFERGHARFFVLDARSERYTKPGFNQMIGEQQLQRLFAWLLEHREAPKFIATCVPFVGELRRDAEDKWCGPAFRPQRERIIDFMAAHGLENVIFLTGDVHNSYHATMEVTRPDGRKLILHELMSSPVNHFNKSGPHDYMEPHPFVTASGRNAYLSRITSGTFFGGHSNVMAVEVTPAELRWEIYRTKKALPAEVHGTIGFTH